jgi:hypothetical protein
MEAGREIEKIGSVGRALPHVEVDIRDPQGRPLPAGEAGEICLRGAKITQGYWRDEKKTAASFYGDWFRTGYVGYLDDDGFLFLTDRVKDMIISGGENIASSEVERVVYQMPQVREAAIIGLPDEKWGERPVAVIALNPGHTLDYEHFKARLHSRRSIRLWFEMHYFAHLVVCRIGRIQPSDPLLPTSYVVKESPVSRTTTVADPVKVGGGQDFQSGWRGVVFDAIELAQIIAITDLCDNLTCFRAFLVNKVQTNEIGWLMVFGFGHELRYSMCWSCLAAYWSCLSA